MHPFYQEFWDILVKAEMISSSPDVKSSQYLPWKPNAFFVMQSISKIFERCILEFFPDCKYIIPSLICADSVAQLEKHYYLAIQNSALWIQKCGLQSLQQDPYLVRTGTDLSVFSMAAEFISNYSQLPFHCYCTLQSCLKLDFSNSNFQLYLNTLPSYSSSIPKEQIWNEMYSFVKDEQEALSIRNSMWFCFLKMLKQLSLHSFCGHIFRKPLWTIPHLYYLWKENLSNSKNSEPFVETYEIVMPNGKTFSIAQVTCFQQLISKAHQIRYANFGSSEHANVICFGVNQKLTTALWALLSHSVFSATPQLTPVQIVIIPIFVKGKDSAVQQKCHKWQQLLSKNNWRVVVDESEKSPGEKFYFWEERGVCLRLEIGPKDVKNSTVCVAVKQFGNDKAPSKKEFCSDATVEEEAKIITKINQLIETEITEHLVQYQVERMDAQYTSWIQQVSAPSKDYITQLKDLESLKRISHKLSNYGLFGWMSFESTKLNTNSVEVEIQLADQIFRYSMGATVKGWRINVDVDKGTLDLESTWLYASQNF